MLDVADRNPRFRVGVCGAGVVVIVALALAVVAGHRGGLTQQNDLGNALAALAAVVDGDLWMPQANTIDGVVRSRFAVHANWTLPLLAPGWALFGAVFHLLTSVAAAAVGAVAIVALGRRRRAAFAVGLAWLVHPAVADAVVYDGHLTVFAAASLLVAAALAKTQPRLAVLALLIAALTKEDMPVVILFAALPLWLDGRRHAAGVCVVVGIVVVVVDAVVLRACGGPVATDRFDWLREAGPGDVLAVVLAPSSLRLPVYVAVTGGLAALVRVRWLVPALPVVGLCMLDPLGFMTRIAGAYYLPVVIACVAVAILAASEDEAGAGAGRAWFFLIASLLASLLLSPIPTILRVPPRTDLDAVHRIEARAGATTQRLCVQNNLGPQLDPRRPLLSWPRCRPGDPLLVLLAPVGVRDRGLCFRCQPTTLLGGPPSAFVDDVIARARRDGVVAHEQGVWLLGPHRDARALDDDDRAALDADLDAFAAGLAALQPSPAPLRDALVDLATAPRRWGDP